MTLKQRLFAKKYVDNGGNGVQASLSIYNTKDYNTAHAIATENLQKPAVVEEINRILDSKNLSIDTNVANLATIANSTPPKGFSGQEVLKANLETIRLRGYDSGTKVTQTSVSLKAELSKKSYQELLKLHRQYTDEINELLAE